LVAWRGADTRGENSAVESRHRMLRIGVIVAFFLLVATALAAAGGAAAIGTPSEQFTQAAGSSTDNTPLALVAEEVKEDITSEDKVLVRPGVMETVSENGDLAELTAVLPLASTPVGKAAPPASSASFTNASSRAPDSVAPRRLGPLERASVNATGPKSKTFKIGLTVSDTVAANLGTTWPRCILKYPNSTNIDFDLAPLANATRNALNMWKSRLEIDYKKPFGSRYFLTQDGHSIKVELVIRDDQNNQTLAEYWYKRFTTTTDPDFCHILLGPLNNKFSHSVAQIANATQRLIVFWSTDLWMYTTGLGYHESVSPCVDLTIAQFCNSSKDSCEHPVPSHLQAVKVNEDETRTHTASKTRRLEASHAGSRVLTGSQSSAAANGGTNLCSSYNDCNYTLVFDMVVQAKDMARDGLRHLLDRRASKIDFITEDPEEYSGPIGDTRKYLQALKDQRVCASLANFSRDLGATVNVLMGTIASGLVLSDSAAWVLCGSASYINQIMLMAKAAEYNPAAILLAKPFGKTLVEVMEGYNVNYVLEPLPWIPFDSGPGSDAIWDRLKTFWVDYQEDFGIEPTLPAMQVAVVGSMLTETFMEKDWAYDGSLDLHHLATSLRARRRETFMGPVEFDNHGLRVDAPSGTRQFVPFGVAGVIEKPDSFYRYLESKLVIIKPLNTAVDPEFEHLFQNMTFPIPTWKDKVVEVSFCRAGCMARNLQCRPCSPGTHRGLAEGDCRDCTISGGIIEYADTYGQSSCKVCPQGAFCNDSSGTPTAIAGYYRVGRGDAPELDSSNNDPTASVRDVCSEPESEGTKYEYVQCHPASVCLGANKCLEFNRGVLCQECDQGYSAEGVDIGKCQECPGWQDRFIRCVIFFGIYAAFIAWLSHISYTDAFTSDSIAVPTTRIALHHLHMLGCVFEVTRLDATSEKSLVNSIILVPANVMYKPTELAAMKCLVQTGDPFDGVVGVLFLTVVGFVATYIVIVVINHARFTLARWTRNVPFIGQPARTGSSTKFVNKKDGAGQAFDKMHIRFMQEHYIMSGVRQSVCWTLLAYPIIVRACMRVLWCNNTLDPPRLKESLDLKCNPASLGVLFYAGTIFLIIIGVGIPLFVFLMLFSHRRKMSDMYVLWTLGPLFIGYRRGVWYYEVIMLFRILVLGIMEAEVFTNAPLCQFVIVAAFWALSKVIVPFDARGRSVLKKLDRDSSIAIGFTVFCSMLLGDSIDQLGLDELTAFAAPFKTGHLRSAMLFLVFVANSIFVLVAARAVMYDQLVMPLQIFEHANEYVLGADTRVLLYFARFFQGLNMSYMHTHTSHGSPYIDTKTLNDAERQFLLDALMETLSENAHSTNMVDHNMLALSLQHAYSRAAEGRAATLQTHHEHRGTHAGFFLSFGCCCPSRAFNQDRSKVLRLFPAGLCMVRRRTKKECESREHKHESSSALRTGSNKEVGSRRNGKARNRTPEESLDAGNQKPQDADPHIFGSTIAGVHSALLSVNADMSERHPYLTSLYEANSKTQIKPESKAKQFTDQPLNGVVEPLASRNHETNSDQPSIKHRVTDRKGQFVEEDREPGHNMSVVLLGLSEETPRVQQSAPCDVSGKLVDEEHRVMQQKASGEHNSEEQVKGRLRAATVEIARLRHLIAQKRRLEVKNSLGKTAIASSNSIVGAREVANGVFGIVGETENAKPQGGSGPTDMELEALLGDVLPVDTAFLQSNWQHVEEPSTTYSPRSRPFDSEDKMLSIPIPTSSAVAERDAIGCDIGISNEGVTGAAGFESAFLAASAAYGAETLPIGTGRYLVDSLALTHMAPGVCFRSAPILENKLPDFVAWGSVLEGSIVDEEWLKVDHGRYLPFKIWDEVVVRPYVPEESTNKK